MSTTPKKKNDGNNDGNSNSHSNSSDDDDKGMFSSWTTWFDELSDRQRLDRLRSCSELDQILKSCQEKAKQQKRIQKRRQQQQQEQQEEGKTRSSGWSLWNRSSSQQQQESDAVSYSSQAVDYGCDDDDDTQAIDLIERTSQGIRSMKYFGWRGVLSSKGSSNPDSANETAAVRNDSSNDNVNDTDRKNNNTMIRQLCSREQHAVWACRAVATSCGHDLSLLKTCFENGGGNDNASSDDQRQPGTPRRKFSTVDILTTPHTAYHLGGGGDSGSVNKKQNKMNIPCYDQQVQLGQCVTTQAQALLERKRRREDKTQR